MDNKTVKQITEVNGAILTPNVIAYIVGMQKNNNEMLKDTMENISDAVCLISSHLDDFNNNEQTDVYSTLISLSLIRGNLKELLKP